MPKPWERQYKTTMPAKPWERFAPAQEPTKISPVKAFKAIPKSFLRTVKQYSYPIRHPIKTTEGIVDLAIGLGAKAVPGRGIAADYEDKVDMTVKALKDEYGGKEQLIRKFNEDPVGMATDIAFIAAGGAGVAAKWARVAGLGRTASILGKTAKYATKVNPLVQAARGTLGTAKLAVKGGGSLLRATAGVFPETIKQIKRIGISKVEKAGRKGIPSGIFTQELVPRVQKNFNALIKNVTDDTYQFLKKSGISDSSINSIKKYGIDSVKLTAKRLNEGYGTLVDRVKKGLLSRSESASKAYKAVFKKSKTDMIPINKSVDSMRAMLVQADVMTPDGVLKSIEKLSPTQKAMVSLYDDMRLKSANQSGLVSKTEYSTYRDRITDLGKGTDFENRLARRVKTMMNEEASRVMPELKKVNKLYREKSLMMDENFDVLNESILKRKTWDLATRKRLKELNDFMPDEYKFLDDIEKLKAADELRDIITSYNDPVFIENQLNRFKQYKDPGIAKLDEIRDLYKHFKDKKIPDDALSVSLARDIHQPVVSPFQAVPRKTTEAIIRGQLRVHEIGKTPATRIRDILTKPIGGK